MCKHSCPIFIKISRRLHFATWISVYWATDASNKGSLKCFLIVLHCFHFDEGVQHVLLDFYGDSDESLNAVSKHLINKLEARGLSLSEAYACTADNASVNYGKHNSVFQKHKSVEPDILAANCLAHICTILLSMLLGNYVLMLKMWCEKFTVIFGCR